ncbi:MAG: TIGR00180 family glycosyltransferase [Acidimicrobiales bacterium]|nr:TIGR00180 family glycosyltransferase [Acidimicrobiales bacterium]
MTEQVESWSVDGIRHGEPWGINEDLLSDLTVVVPTWSRQDFVLRQLRFWSSSAARLIVVDGSDSALSDRVRSAVADHPRLTYLHHRCSFADRLRIAGEHLSSKYAVMLGDDEFHLPSGLRAAVRILNEDADLVGCMGQVLSFSPMDGYRRCLFSRAYPGMADFSAMQKDPTERLVAAMDPYTMATCYAVLRTPVWQRSWGSVGSYSSGVAAEMQQAFTVHLLGPFRSNNAVQWLRSVENSITPVSDLESERGRMLWFPEWWENHKWDVEHHEFLDRITAVVAERVGLPRPECRQAINAGAQLFATRNRAEFDSLDQVEGGGRPKTSLLTRVARIAAARFPDGVALTIRHLRSIIQKWRGAQGGDYLGATEELPSRLENAGLVSTSELLKEVAQVEKLVRDFHLLRNLGLVESSESIEEVQK